MKVIVLGDMHFDNIYPVLQPVAERILVLATRPPEGKVVIGPEVEWRYVNGPMESHRILALISEFGARLVLSRIRGTESEPELIQHSLAAQMTTGDVSFPMHPPEFAAITVDKALFQHFAEQHGLPVPRGVVCEGVADLIHAVDQVGGFPVIVKQALALAGRGVWYVRSREDLEQMLPGEIPGPFVLQEALQGIEAGVEVISAPDKTWRFPLISMGPLDSALSPQCRLRKSPHQPGAAVNAALSAVIDRIEATLRPHGPWQMDMAICGDRLYVLEINGRLGGLSNLSYHATGLDPHVAACRVALGDLPPVPEPVRVAMELPVRRSATVRELDTDELQVVLQPSRSLPNWKLAVSSGNAEALLSYIHSIPHDDLCMPLSAVVEGAQQAFAELGCRDKAGEIW